MAKLREESRPLVEASKELRSLIREVALSESARCRLEEFLK